MRTKQGLLLIVIVLGFVLVLCGQSPKEEEKKMLYESKENAERLWELAIQAKGGRERLHSIKNIVISSEGNFYKGLKKIKIRLEDLYVFPNKWWSWNDQRPSVFGLSMSMHNWETGRQYNIQYGSSQFKGLATITEKKEVPGFPGLIHYLLETKWDKPIPQRVYNGKVGGNNVDIIQTRLLNWKTDFAFDQKTHLLLRSIAYREDIPTSIISLSDYFDVNGIKMPSKIVYEGSDGDMKYKCNYKFNADYDESIFEKPPPFEAGPEAWKKEP